MKKKEILSAVQLYLAPVLVIVLGVLLLINPDSASVLISRVLGAVLTVLGVIFGITALFSERRRVGKLITALCILMGGGILSARPLLLAAFAGRVVGLLLFADGIGDLINARRSGAGSLMSLLVTVLGGVLILMPMGASRLVFRLCGLVVAVIGVAMLTDRLRHRRLPGGDSNIIDAL